MNRIFFLGGLIAFSLVSSNRGETAPDPAEGVIATVNGFHDALHRGDREAVLNSLESDAIILESGSIQTREEYAREHLAEDIAFVKAIPGTRSNLSVKEEDNFAWTTATTQFVGTFNGREVNSAGVELMVLTKRADGWRIRAVHWSSRRMTKSE